jgi:hypothetical protein
MHQARHRAPPFDITIESRSRRGTTLVRVRRADGRLRVDEAPEGDRGGPSTLVEADGRWLVTRADGTASTGEGATTRLFDGPWMPVVDLVIDPSPLLPQHVVALEAPMCHDDADCPGSGPRRSARDRVGQLLEELARRG